MVGNEFLKISSSLLFSRSSQEDVSFLLRLAYNQFQRNYLKVNREKSLTFSHLFESLIRQTDTVCCSIKTIISWSFRSSKVQVLKCSKIFSCKAHKRWSAPWAGRDRCRDIQSQTLLWKCTKCPTEHSGNRQSGTWPRTTKRIPWAKTSARAGLAWFIRYKDGPNYKNILKKSIWAFSGLLLVYRWHFYKWLVIWTSRQCD